MITEDLKAVKSSLYIKSILFVFFLKTKAVIFLKNHYLASQLYRIKKAPRNNLSANTKNKLIIKYLIARLRAVKANT